MHKFSIGIPAFKSRYLKECISSILNQSYSNFELIIVNDCSPYPVDKVVESFSDTRIRYYKNERNIGAEHVVDNWNKCLEKATGEFFVLMGDDDMMMSDYLLEFSRLIDRYPNLDIFHCRSVIIDENGSPQRYSNSWPEYETVYENIWHRIKDLRIQYISDFVYRTSTLKENGGFYKLPLAWASDDISAYIACGEKGIAHSNRPVFCYRENSQTISNTGNRQLKMQGILEEELWLANFLQRAPSEERDVVVYENVKSEVKRFIQKKKIKTISLGIYHEGLKSLPGWFFLRNKYGYSVSELLYAVLESIKRKKAQKNY